MVRPASSTTGAAQHHSQSQVLLPLSPLLGHRLTMSTQPGTEESEPLPLHAGLLQRQHLSNPGGHHEQAGREQARHSVRGQAHHTCISRCGTKAALVAALALGLPNGRDQHLPPRAPKPSCWSRPPSMVTVTVTVTVTVRGLGLARRGGGAWSASHRVQPALWQSRHFVLFVTDSQHGLEQAGRRLAGWQGPGAAPLQGGCRCC
jgi:hypothetical protein